MQLKKIEINNFRLLHNVALLLERQTTVIVGRNNSGKTSLTEIVSRVLAEGNSTFCLEDFSCASHQCFWNAYLAYAEGAEAEIVRSKIPTIEVTFTFEYASTEDFDSLTDFILDLNLDCTEAQAVVSYRIDEGEIDAFFADISSLQIESKTEFFRTIRPRIRTK
jgi:putative ATP-dependent endonuclease of OLD family